MLFVEMFEMVMPGSWRWSAGASFAALMMSGLAPTAQAEAVKADVAPAAAAAAGVAGDAEAEAPGGSRTDIVVVGDAIKADEIAGSSAIVTDVDLKRSRVFNVNDALRQVAGLFPRDEEGAGARPNIGIRGLNPIRSTKVLLLEDGVPLGFAPYGDNAAYYHPPRSEERRVGKEGRSRGSP